MPISTILALAIRRQKEKTGQGRDADTQLHP
jgi:hypothetical protein